MDFSFLWVESTTVVYQRRFQVLLDYLYGPQRCAQISELIRLHLRSRLVLNTLFLTVNLFDRAILTGQIPRESYSDGNPHLLLTCLLIAGKFEEVEVSSSTSQNRCTRRILMRWFSVAQYQLSDCQSWKVGSTRYQIPGDHCSSIALLWHWSNGAGFRLSLLWTFSYGHLE